MPQVVMQGRDCEAHGTNHSVDEARDGHCNVQDRAGGLVWVDICTQGANK